MALRRSQPGSPPEGGATAGAERMTTAGGGAPVASTQEVLRRLELNVNRRLDGILHGEYRGLVPGHGSEPGETRIYAPGDDTRRIDWNVTARMQTPHIREAVADRELEAWLCVDLSPSLDFGTHTWERRDLALATAAGIGFLSARSGNRVGAVLNLGSELAVVPAKQGRRHLQAILGRIQTAPRATRGDVGLGETLDRLGRVARRRGLAAIISDFLDPIDSWRQPLATVGLRHQVLAAEVLDPREVDLPPLGYVELTDPETGRTREVHVTKAVQARFAEAAIEQRAGIGAAIRSTGADHMVVRTDGDWLLELVRFVAKRRHRAANLGAARVAP